MQIRTLAATSIAALGLVAYSDCLHSQANDDATRDARLRIAIDACAALGVPVGTTQHVECAVKVLAAAQLPTTQPSQQVPSSDEQRAEAIKNCATYGGLPMGSPEHARCVEEVIAKWNGKKDAPLPPVTRDATDYGAIFDRVLRAIAVGGIAMGAASATRQPPPPLPVQCRWIASSWVCQ